MRRLFVLALFFVFSSVSESSSNNLNLVNQVQTYVNNLKSVYSEFVQLNRGKVFKGKFWLKHENDKTQARVSYTHGIKQDIFVDGNEAIIKTEKKSRTISISKSPIYSVLSGQLNLKNEQIKVLENSEENFVIKIFGYLGGDLTLLFSKYESGNLKNWEGWIFSKGNDETLFSFVPETWSVNDEKHFSSKTFDH